jgi:hypothetical protein
MPMYFGMRCPRDRALISVSYHRGARLHAPHLSDAHDVANSDSVLRLRLHVRRHSAHSPGLAAGRSRARDSSSHSQRLIKDISTQSSGRS